MNKTLAELLHPRFDYYRSIGELAKTLQFLSSGSDKYRQDGRWGSSGPTEELVNYGGCVNCYNHVWHSNRISNSFGHSDITTWQQNHDGIYRCILAGLCHNDKPSIQWRREKGISLEMTLKFSMAYQSQDEEKKAWIELEALHGYKLPVSTINSCHRSVNVLCGPELVITRTGVHIDCKVTQRQEFRKKCRSAWNVVFLCRDNPKFSRTPRWNSHNETFAAFILRAAVFYKSVKL